MNISIWNKIEKKWLNIKDVKDIYQSSSSLHYFEVDNHEYNTEKYTLVFIHNN